MRIRRSLYRKAISSHTTMIVGLSLCFQTAATSQAAAETAPRADRPSPFERRASTRIGVSVQVLPSCVIDVSGTVGLDGQPVTVLCTKDTIYDISASQGSGQLSAAGMPSSATQLLGGIVKQSNGKADLFKLRNAQVKTESLADSDSEITVLSINF